VRQTRAGRAARDGRTNMLIAEKIGRCPQSLSGSPEETTGPRGGAEGVGPTTRTEPVRGFDQPCDIIVSANLLYGFERFKALGQF
jgi:hypothetical protein